MWCKNKIKPEEICNSAKCAYPFTKKLTIKFKLNLSVEVTWNEPIWSFLNYKDYSFTTTLTFTCNFLLKSLNTVQILEVEFFIFRILNEVFLKIKRLMNTPFSFSLLRQVLEDILSYHTSLAQWQYSLCIKQRFHQTQENGKNSETQNL